MDFADTATIFNSDIVTIEDDRFGYDELRFITLGLLKGNVIVVVHSQRGEITRIISARKAKSYEREIYFQRFTD
ncbi:BrnT family toxin [Promineifilum sp.]|uniref:BrnT family toxin n=1 Tax=Promineifilum sp. TaxID=2664178 RepID=UPI0035B035F1